jgi:hypothetical protein
MIYSQPPAEHRTTPVKIALLTGLSNPWSCALSDVQRDFMASLHFPEAWKVYRNFPWIAAENPATVTPLWRASVHNGWQFVAASTPLYRWIAKAHWNALLRSADHVVIIAGSCGLQIVNCMLADRSSHATRIGVLAFAPVAWRRPPARCRLVQNERDFVSRCFFRRPEVRLGQSGHMNYLEDCHLIEIAERWISNSISG